MGPSRFLSRPLTLSQSHHLSPFVPAWCCHQGTQGLLHLTALNITDGRENFPGNQPVKVNKISEFKIKTGLVTALCPAILESKTKRKISTDPVFI